jgi:hypothetical protein
VSTPHKPVSADKLDKDTFHVSLHIGVLLRPPISVAIFLSYT